MHSFAIELDGELIPFEDFFSPITNMNQSRLQFFLDCKRKYWWLFEIGLVPDRPRWALEDGKAFHEGMAVMGGGHGVEKAVRAATESLRESLPKQKLMYDETELKEHVILVERLIRAYDIEYGGKVLYQPLGIECSGRVEVGEGTGCFLVFRTDRLVNWANRIWIVDHKTAAKLDMRDVMKYEMDLQFTAYVYGASKILGERVAGVIVDVITKAQTIKFHQEPFARSDDELLDFEGEFVEMVREIAWRRARVKAGENPKNVWYKNTKECFRYGTCPYRDLCLEDNPVKRALFMQRDKDYVDDADRGSKAIDPVSVNAAHQRGIEAAGRAGDAAEQGPSHPDSDATERRAVPGDGVPGEDVQ
jgi:hypothetical protein